ncbi:MAG: HEAT repeat domain-containing protein [Planctomycetes bacterium]|nr:HEAT repeat domain-containing protein [Planctomycetota bacterium]
MASIALARPAALYVAALCAGGLIVGCRLLPGLIPSEKLGGGEIEALRASLAGDVWLPDPEWSVVRDARAGLAQLPPLYRWRFGGRIDDHGPLEPGEDAASRRLALEVLAERDEPAGWNAAILLAREHPEQDARLSDVLERLVTGRTRGGLSAFKLTSRAPAAEPSASLRAAAAEAWCGVLAARSADDPFKALAPAGRALEDAALPELVRTELIYGICRRIPPRAVRAVEDALKNTAGTEPSLRRAAMEACALHALWNRPESATIADAAVIDFREDGERWPAVLLDSRRSSAGLARDADAGVRAAWLLWLAAVRDPQAAQSLETALRDRDEGVRERAAIGLGVLGTAEARTLLEAEIAKGTNRTAAARALTAWGADAVRPLLEAGSPHLALVIARELHTAPAADAGLLLENLLRSRSPEVHTAAIEAVDGWPDEWAVPVLLEGLRSDVARIRRSALSALRLRCPKVPGDFPCDETDAAVRAEAVARLIHDAGLPTRPVEPPAVRAPQNERVPDAAREAWVVGVLQDAVLAVGRGEPHSAVLARLRGFEAADVPVLERFLGDSGPGSPAAELSRLLTETVLLELAPQWKALVELASSDRAARRKAAQDLAEVGRERTLSPALVQRLEERLIASDDAEVWRFVLEAVAADATPESERLMVLAAQHARADIRLAACRYAARHRLPRFAAWLTPLLADGDFAVRLAAVEASGVCGNPVVIGGRPEHGLPGLRDMLRDQNDRLRIGAAIALARLGDRQGLEELLRLSNHPERAIRKSAVRGMSGLGDRQIERRLREMAVGERDAEVRREIEAPGLQPVGFGRL